MCFRRGLWTDGKAQTTNRFLRKVDWLSLGSRTPWFYNLNEALQHLRTKASQLVCRSWPVTSGTLLLRTYVRLLVKPTKLLVSRRLQLLYHHRNTVIGIEIIGSSAYSACLDGTHKAFSIDYRKLYARRNGFGGRRSARTLEQRVRKLIILYWFICIQL